MVAIESILLLLASETCWSSSTFVGLELMVAIESNLSLAFVDEVLPLELDLLRKRDLLRMRHAARSNSSSTKPSTTELVISKSIYYVFKHNGMCDTTEFVTAGWVLRELNRLLVKIKDVIFVILYLLAYRAPLRGAFLR